MAVKTTLGLIAKFRKDFFQYPSLFLEGFGIKITDTLETLFIFESNEVYNIDDTVMESLLLSNSEDMLVDYSGVINYIKDGSDKVYTAYLETLFKDYQWKKNSGETVCLVVDKNNNWVKICSSPDVANSFIQSEDESWSYIILPITFEV